VHKYKITDQPRFVEVFKGRRCPKIKVYDANQEGPGEIPLLVTLRLGYPVSKGVLT
jgi:hypothetical protein